MIFLEESLSTLYEAEEEPGSRSDSDGTPDDYGEIILESNTSSTLTVIHQKQNSLDDVDDIIEQISQGTNDVIDDQAPGRKSKKVYRR